MIIGISGLRNCDRILLNSLEDAARTVALELNWSLLIGMEKKLRLTKKIGGGVGMNDTMISKIIPTVTYCSVIRAIKIMTLDD